MTHAELMALPHHPDWFDGREGFMWARFDAVVDESRGLRAEVTWADDDEDEPEDRAYYEPELLLETNEQDGECWKRLHCRVLVITQEEALAIVAAAPRELLAKYREEFAQLEAL